MAFPSLTKHRFRVLAVLLALLPALAGCGWVYPETADPDVVLAYEAEAMQPPRSPMADAVGDRHPGARPQPLSPAARLLAHELQLRLENRTLGFPGGPGFDMVEVFVAALDVEEYVAAKERFAMPEQAAALFMPDTDENRERYYRESLGSAVTLRFHPGGPSTQILGRNDPFWIIAADRNAVGLLLIACLPGGRTATRMLSLEKGAWPGRHIDLLLTAGGWSVLSAQRR